VSTRTRVLSVAALTALALSVSGLATAASTDPRADDAPPRVEPLEHLSRGWSQPRARALLGPAAVHPVRGPVDYGEGGAQYGADRGGRMHEGQDVFAPAGTPLVAVRDGVVLETGDDGGRGNYVGIYSPEARETYVYLHMLAPSLARPGERVRVGTRVGQLGCTGSCFGDHLHFEVRRGRSLEGPPRDPRGLLRRLAR